MSAVRLRVLLAAGCLLLPAVPAVAQKPPAAAARREVDESALRFYALQNNQVRVDAEIRRLRTLHPDWQVPADLYTGGGGAADETALWDLFAAHDLDGLRAAIAARQAREPGWTPSDDLLLKLELKEARRRLVAAYNEKRWAGVIEEAAATPALVGPGDVDLLWRLAEAYGRAGQPERSLEIDRLILSGPAGPAERLATVQKAMAVLRPREVDTLLVLGRTLPDGTGEFEPVRLDLARARIGAILAGTVGADEPAPADLARLEAATRAGSTPGDPTLLAWYRHGRKEWRDAAEWFKAALDRGSTEAKVALGAAMTARELGRQDEAEAIAWDWHGKDDELAEFFLTLVTKDLTEPVPPVIAAERLRRAADVTGKIGSDNGAQALGWYAYNVGQFGTAKLWFEKAMNWQPAEKTAEGLVLSVLRLGDKATFASLVRRFADSYPSVAALAVAVERPREAGARPDAAWAAYRAKNYPRCLAVLTGRERRSGLRPEDAAMKGWCLLGVSRPQEAALAFDRALRGPSPTAADAAFGKSLAHLRSGLTDAAVAAAHAAPLSADRRNEIGLTVLSQRAASHFAARDYPSTLKALDDRRAFAAEPRDLALLRGWSLYHLARHDQAFATFKRLDAQLSTAETRAGLHAAEARLHPIRD